MNTAYRLSLSLLLAAGATSAGCSAGDPIVVEETDEQELSVGAPLRYDSYDVLFTNPLCKKYEYETPIKSVSNKTLTHKPENVFCTRADSAASAARDGAPQKRLIEWIRDPGTKEIFFAYLSFSNSVVADEICKAITDRNVKVSFVLDSTSDTKLADKLLACKPSNGDPNLAPKFYKRGHVSGIGYAHNKLFFINPSGDHPRIVFSSGNLSSGVVLHHENWHFIQVPADTHFAQSHRCLMQGVIDHAESGAEYRKFMSTCRGAITKGEEKDIRTFFVPGQGNLATKALVTGIQSAKKIDLGAHRFSYRTMTEALRSRLTGSNKAEIRLVADDDAYWIGQGIETGDNTKDEYWEIKKLADVGMKVKWMETNHAMHYLHHNKFAIFTQPQGSNTPDGVFCGAGNLTGTAFSSNFENFYYITIPHVVDAFKAQYKHLYEDLATSPQDLPKENVLPPGTGG